MTQPVDRERASLQAILDALLPNYLYTMVWAYRVTGSEGTGPVTISAVSEDPRMPNQSRIVLRPGPDGGYSTPAPGSEVAIGFLNGDPERPYVHSLDPTAPSLSTWVPSLTLVSLGPGTPAALAHSLEVLTILAAVLVELNADFALLTTPPTNTSFSQYATAKAPLLTTLIAAITAQLATLSTIVTKAS